MKIKTLLNWGRESGTIPDLPAIRYDFSGDKKSEFYIVSGSKEVCEGGLLPEIFVCDKAGFDIFLFHLAAYRKFR